MSTAAYTRGTRPRSTLLAPIRTARLLLVAGMSLLACRPTTSQPPVAAVSMPDSITPSEHRAVASPITPAVHPESAVLATATATARPMHASLTDERDPSPSTPTDPSPTAATTSASAPTSTTALAATPASTQCAVPEPTATWAGRDNDDQWARGLYPAKERYPDGWMALTFDDGPHRSRTPKALDLLEKHELHATFFLTGFAIRSSTYHLVQRMVEEGHTLANHGWRHDVGMTRKADTLANLEDYIGSELELTQIRVDLAMMAQSAEDFAAMDARVFEGLRRWHERERQLEAMPALRERHRELLQERGYDEDARPVQMHWVRPPGGIPYMGRRTVKEREAFARVLNRMGLRLAMWNAGSGDSNPHLDHHERMDPDRIAKSARKAARRGGIYIAHDRMAAQGMKAMIKALANSNAELVSLDQLEQAKHEARGWCEAPSSPVLAAL